MSRYSAAKHRLDIMNNKGFDYKDMILMRSMTQILFKNPMFLGFAQKIEDIVFDWFYQAKSIKKFFNYIVPMDSDDIN